MRTTTRIRIAAGTTVVALLMGGCSSDEGAAQGEVAATSPSPEPSEPPAPSPEDSSEGKAPVPVEDGTPTAAPLESVDADSVVAALAAVGVCESPEPKEGPPPGWGEDSKIVCSAGENASTAVMTFASVDAAGFYVCSSRGESRYAHAAGSIVVEIGQTFGAAVDLMDQVRSEVSISLERPDCDAFFAGLEQARADAVESTMAALGGVAGCEPVDEAFLARIGRVDALVQECRVPEGQRVGVLGFLLAAHTHDSLALNAETCPTGEEVAGLQVERILVFVSVNSGDERGFAATEDDLARLGALADQLGGEVVTAPCQPA